MNELIKIKEENCQRLVSARELHEFLEVTERFQQWFDKRVSKYDFLENEDYIGCKIFHKLAKQELQDYIITLDMAIVICRISKGNPKSIEMIKYLQLLCGKTIEVKEQKRLEYQFGDMLKTITGVVWKEQYQIDNGKYKLDFYLKDILIVEYDEEHHMCQRENDHKRIIYCRDWLANNDSFYDNWRCPVIRVKKGEELEGLNRIIRHLAGFECFDTQYNYDLNVCDYGIK